MSSRTSSTITGIRFVTDPEQLSLLTAPVNPRFQLSRETRARGLRHVAQIRQMLASTGTTDPTGATAPTGTTDRPALRYTSRRAA